MTRRDVDSASGGDVFIGRTLLPDVRGLPRTYWILLGATLLDRLGGFVVPYLAIYLTTVRAFSVTQAGLVMSAWGVGGMVGGPLGGIATDRIGRKPIVVGGWLAMSVAMLHLSTARTFFHVVVATAILSATYGFVRPAMNAAIADVVPEADRRRAYGLQYWALNLGFAVAAVLASQLIKLSYTLVFALDAATSVATALFLLVLFKESRPIAAPGTETGGRMDLSVLRDRALLAVFVMSLCAALGFQQAHVALATEMTRDGLVGAYGPIIAINGVLIVLLQPLIVKRTETLHARYTLAIGVGLVGLGFFLTAFADLAWQHVIPIVVWTVGEMFLAATTPTVIAKLAPPHLRGTYVGMHQLSWSVAAFGPALGAWLLDAHGSLALWSAVLGTCLFAAAWIVRLRDPRLA